MGRKGYHETQSTIVEDELEKWLKNELTFHSRLRQKKRVVCCDKMTIHITRCACFKTISTYRVKSTKQNLVYLQIIHLWGIKSFICLAIQGTNQLFRSASTLLILLHLNIKYTFSNHELHGQSTTKKLLKAKEIFQKPWMLFLQNLIRLLKKAFLEVWHSLIEPNVHLLSSLNQKSAIEIITTIFSPLWMLNQWRLKKANQTFTQAWCEIDHTRTDRLYFTITTRNPLCHSFRTLHLR